MSYSVKLVDEILISGFSAIQPNYIFSHHRIIAENVSSDFSAVMDTGGDTEVTFDLAEYIGKKGLRFHDRSSKLTLAAIRVLLNETKLLDRYPSREVNLVVGSDGALQSQNDVVREAMLTPKAVNPKAYPNRGCNVIAGQASLMFGLLGESTVISSGYRSGIDALIYAVRKILVASSPISYVVAAGEGLSEARSLRKKCKTCAENHYILPIEAAVALTVERAVDRPEVEPAYRVVGYQQTQTENPDHAQVHLQEFVSSLGYSSEAIDAVIVGHEDMIHTKTQAGRVVPYDVFGATGLLHLVEIFGLRHTCTDALPKTIALSQSDRNGCMSMLLLRRKPN